MRWSMQTAGPFPSGLGDGTRRMTTSRGTKMPAYRIRWRDSERPEIVLQHMLIADRSDSPPEGEP